MREIFNGENRSFKGIWIPAEIWLCNELSIMDVILLSEIDSLDKEKGCFASNGYLSKFLGISKINVSKHIKKLKTLGLIYQESFDGRKRILRSNVKKMIANGIDLSQTISPHYRKQQGCIGTNDKHITKENNKDIEKNIYTKSAKADFDNSSSQYNDSVEDINNKLKQKTKERSVKKQKKYKNDFDIIWRKWQDSEYTSTHRSNKQKEKAYEYYELLRDGKFKTKTKISTEFLEKFNIPKKDRKYTHEQIEKIIDNCILQLSPGYYLHNKKNATKGLAQTFRNTHGLESIFLFIQKNPPKKNKTGVNDKFFTEQAEIFCDELEDNSPIRISELVRRKIKYILPDIHKFYRTKINPTVKIEGKKIKRSDFEGFKFENEIGDWDIFIFQYAKFLKTVVFDYNSKFNYNAATLNINTKIFAWFIDWLQDFYGFDFSEDAIEMFPLLAKRKIEEEKEDKIQKEKYRKKLEWEAQATRWEIFQKRKKEVMEMEQEDFLYQYDPSNCATPQFGRTREEGVEMEHANVFGYYYRDIPKHDYEADKKKKGIFKSCDLQNV